jgi:hypothetical protein
MKLVGVEIDTLRLFLIHNSIFTAMTKNYIYEFYYSKGYSIGGYTKMQHNNSNGMCNSAGTTATNLLSSLTLAN